MDRQRTRHEADDGRRPRLRGGVLVAVLAAALVAGPARADDASDDRADGRALYDAIACAGCHESGARPGMVARPLSRLSDRYDETSLTAFLAAPSPPMPVFELTDEERRALAGYLLRRFP